MNEHKLPMSLTYNGVKYKFQLTDNGNLVAMSQEGQSINLVTSVDSFSVKIFDDTIILIVIKESKIWSTTVSKKDIRTPEGLDHSISPMFQKGHEHIRLGSLAKTSQDHSNQNLLMCCTSSDNIGKKLLVWEKKSHQWLGPIELDSGGDDIKLTSSSMQKDSQGYVHLIYILKNGRQEWVLHRSYSPENKWTNPVIIYRGKLDEQLIDPVLISSPEGLAIFWGAHRVETVKIYHTFSKVQRGPTFTQWEVPQVLMNVKDYKAPLWLAAGQGSNGSLWVLWKSNQGFEAYHQVNNHWEHLLIPKGFKPLKFDSPQDLGWGQRIIGDGFNFWVPTHPTIDQVYRTQQSQTGSPVNKREKFHQQFQNTSHLIKNWYADTTPQSPKDMLMNDLQKKGMASKQTLRTNYQRKQAPQSSKNHAPFSSDNKEIVKFKKQVKNLYEEQKKLADLQKEMFDRLDSLEKTIKKLSVDNNQKANLWDRFFK